MKIAVNRCWGGFGLSALAQAKLQKLGENREVWEIPRHDENLIRVIEELGDAADGDHSSLKVVEIPDNVEYVIHEYDGNESIHEKHRVWG